jgi:hypothetical protein
LTSIQAWLIMAGRPGSSGHDSRLPVTVHISHGQAAKL